MILLVVVVVGGCGGVIRLYYIILDYVTQIKLFNSGLHWVKWELHGVVCVGFSDYNTTLDSLTLG